MPEVKLKSCPFCGRKAIEVENWKIKGGILYGVRCVHCGAVTGYYEDEADAFEAWNKRAPEKNAGCAHNESKTGFLCSACRFGDFGQFNHGGKYAPKYCPCCGAKMDGGE